MNSPVSGSVFTNQMAALAMFRHSAHDRATAILRLIPMCGCAPATIARKAICLMAVSK